MTVCGIHLTHPLRHAVAFLAIDEDMPDGALAVGDLVTAGAGSVSFSGCDRVLPCLTEASDIARVLDQMTAVGGSLPVAGDNIERVDTVHCPVFLDALDACAPVLVEAYFLQVDVFRALADLDVVDAAELLIPCFFELACFDGGDVLAGEGLRELVVVRAGRGL